ncbi:hypothetical protein SASPL_137672 [Salvia splendens]|uniref:rhamnogalacturonan endolyase n=1 Tax=Salvia splendens TaxID=180675 RepID=A0A8X8ZDN6_SALSN|nr:hypothetical protein SASPL_137672 [Salvia splendens]
MSRLFPVSNQELSPPVQLHVTPTHVEIDNGIVKLTLMNPGGLITSVGYNGVDNILEYSLTEDRRGYWDIVWSRPDRSGSNFDMLFCTRFRVIVATADQVEVSFTKTRNPSLDKEVPLNVDKRYILLRGSSGFYSYSTFEHLQGWPALNIDEARIAFKLHQDMFNYMVISDDKQRVMPTDKDRQAGDLLAYPEAVIISHPSNPQLKGEVDDKYEYSCNNEDNHVHGWISSTNPRTGFWVVMPGDEFRAGGPIKQDLTSHAGPTSLATFFSNHYAGDTFGVSLHNGEPWKKVFGPVFMYLNSGPSTSAIWDDAKRQTAEEMRKWPYDFPQSPDFPDVNRRGAITGRLLVHDIVTAPAQSAYVGLAPPGVVGSWQEDTKGYQFWTRTDKNGYYSSSGVRAGTYNLYAWVPGVIGDYKHPYDITILPGKQVAVGEAVYSAPRNGPTLWEIGIPDRTAAEFYVPDPNPNLVNKLFVNHAEKYRQYGLWSRYTDLYPRNDLVYTVGVSDYRKHWFFAHVNRNANGQYLPTTWKIAFNAKNVMSRGTYTLQLALASASYAEVQVGVNDRPHFTTGKIGKENVIARHGIHGLYRLFSVKIWGSLLVEGTNTIYLRQLRGGNPFFGVLYDYIRLEAPPRP